MTEVAAVILYRESGEILICKRGVGGSCAGLWEFPGGKREAGETMEDCAIRECREELGVDVILERVYERHTYSYPDRDIAFVFFQGKIQAGTPTLYVHQGMCWVLPNELHQFTFCPGDVELVKKLQQTNEAVVSYNS